MPRDSKPAAILAVILISYCMILLDNSVIFTGLPSIRAGLELSPTGLSWVQDAYTLVFGGLLLLGARAGDLVGRRRLFVIGLGIFGTASLLIGLAPAGWWMIAARALQGVGAAIVAPTSLALITAYFEGEARSRAVALYAATAGIGASLGLLVGGALTDLISWRAAFLVNVPIAVAMIVGARAVLTETPRQHGRFDVGGALCATAGMGALVFGIIESGEAGWGSARVVVALVVGALLLTALVVTESRAAQPVMPLRLLASRERSGAYAARALCMGAMIGFFFFTTQLMQDALGFTPLQAGLGFPADVLGQLRRRAGHPAAAHPGPRRRPARRRRAADAGRHGLAEPGRPRRGLPDLGRAAHGAGRCGAGPGVRPTDQLGHRRGGPIRRRGRVRAGQHRPPARDGARAGGAVRGCLRGRVLASPAQGLSWSTSAPR